MSKTPIELDRTGDLNAAGREIALEPMSIGKSLANRWRFPFVDDLARQGRRAL